MLHVVMKNSSKWPMVPSTYSKIFRSNVRKIRTLEDLEKISIFFQKCFRSICFTIFIRENIFSTAPPSIDRQPRARHVPPRLKPVRVVSKDRKPKKSKESENKINKTAKGWYQLAPI